MSETRTISLQTNFNGLIYLLADGLYSTSDIFARELIQNAHDGIVRRQALEKTDSYHGMISVTYDIQEHTITFSDNGIGMDEHDIIKFLSVIGSTGSGTKREELEAAFADALIGRFGIGILSSFLVANKVCVRTKKLGSQEAFQWINTGSTECTISPIQKEKTGTSVILYLNSKFDYLLDAKKLSEIIIRYCDLINVPIMLNNSGPINAVYAPWDQEYSSPEQERNSYMDFIKRHYPNMYIDVFPIKINKQAENRTYRANGVLFITNKKFNNTASVGTLDIYIRKMLVKTSDTILLPSWAKFTRGIIDSPDLKPTAGRDNINQDSTAFHVLQTELGNQIIERLTYLAEHQPDKFEFINISHHDHLKGMAMNNNDFLNKIEKLLLFSTNHGPLTLSQYLPKNPMLNGLSPIYYFTHYDSAAQYYRMADENGICIINAGGRYDKDLLEKYGQKHPETILKKLNVLDSGILFEELSQEERAAYRPLETALVNYLNDNLNMNVVPSTKRYVPAAVPALIIETEMDEIERDIQQLMNTSNVYENFGSAFRELTKRFNKKPTHITLNGNNRLIQLLSQSGTILPKKDMQNMLELLYMNAILYSHRLTEQDMNHVHDSVVRLMTQMTETLDKNMRLNQQLEYFRNEKLSQSSESKTAFSDHICLFMMTPFDKSYQIVEDAVRQIFEQAPFYFEVRLARDYYRANDLVKNVREHIASAHGFIAEISELNPNVMMEVGSVLISGDTRPVFALRDNNSQSSVPADFGALLRFSYSRNSSSAEDIAAQIQSQFFTNGRLANAALENLLHARKKHFLSSTLLKGLPNFRLSDTFIRNLCKKYTTIDDFIDADKENLKEVGNDTQLLEWIQTLLKDMIKKEKKNGR